MIARVVLGLIGVLVAVSVAEAAPARSFRLGGQQAWFHDEGHRYGFFHTYDRLSLGAGDAGRKVHVFLPRDYETSGKRYPVVYMNDGNTAFFPGGAANKSWRVAETLSGLRQAGKIEDVIVVAIHPLDREREYTHTFWRHGHACCGLDEYADYVGDRIRGFVDAHYRTDARTERTSIVGSSHGGHAAFYMGTKRADRFGNVGAFSPSFRLGLDDLGDHGPLRDTVLVQRVRAFLAIGHPRPRLWIDWGMKRTGGRHNDFIEAMAAKRGAEMVTLLTTELGYRQGRDLRTWVDHVGGHDEDAWAFRFGELMKTYYPK